MRLLTGTSGFSYKPWKGSFYPADLPDDEMLGYYASRLPTVEINNTFYRLPKQEVIMRWGEKVPDSFVFVIKAPQRITHIARLKDAGPLVDALWQAISPLGSRLGPVLFQLPPFAKKDVALLRDFLAVLPQGCRAAFEFRHESWSDSEVHDALRSAGAALCLADADGAPEPEHVATADWGYLRLRRAAYSGEDLSRWVDRVARSPWREAFVFFKHEDEGIGPKLALEFSSLFAGVSPS
jgi:uncharacterized protein YecE (DUF72 family)